MSRRNPRCSAETRDRLFEELAAAQRHLPENAMLRIQHAHLAAEYGWLCEHVGDLTHRMSEKFSFFEGNYANVRDKVEKTLRVITRSTFARHLEEAIISNVAYTREQIEKGDHSEFDLKYPKTPEAAWEKLRALGSAYAEEHGKLVVYNKMQRSARDSAYYLGKMNFQKAAFHLTVLKENLDRGHEHWTQVAGECDPEYEA